MSISVLAQFVYNCRGNSAVQSSKCRPENAELDRHICPPVRQVPPAKAVEFVQHFE